MNRLSSFIKWMPVLAAVSLYALTDVSAANPRGETLSFTMEDSKVYPGTSRTVKVYVPEQYDGKSPACLAVVMDNLAFGIENAIDELVDSGEMPVTVAVGVVPGRICDENGNVIRYNRSNEFDRTDGKFASFLETEVIPQVCSLKTSDGRAIIISDEARDRMTVGASSGGIAAFAAAWNRPDLFSRVYSIVGTFVPMRGADLLPGIIRKSEPRPLRIFLQDNDKDTWNLLFGSWYEYNLLMESALSFAGYDVAHQWGEGGHGAANGSAIIKDVLRFLWKDYPLPVSKGVSGNKTLAAILDPSSDWTLVDCPAAGSGYVTSCDSDAAVPEILALGESGFNPLVAVYPGGLHEARIEGTGNWVWNYVCGNPAVGVRGVSGAVEGDKAALSFGQEFYYLHSPASQITFDTDGYLYCATALGVQVCDHNGRVRVIIPLPAGETVTSVALRGHRLYAIGGGKLYSREIRRCGFSDASKVAVPKSDGEG